MNISKSLILLMQTEDRNLSNIISMPLNLLLVLSYFLVASYILNIIVTKKQKYVYIALSTICFTVLNILLPLQIYRIIYLILNMLLIITILKVDVLKAILFQCITVLIAATIETVIYFYISYFIDQSDFSNILYVVKYRLITVLSIILFAQILYILVRALKLRVTDVTINKRLNLLIISLIVMFVMTSEITQLITNSGKDMFFSITNIFAMLLFFYLVINNIYKFSEIEKYQNQIEELELYNRTLLENQDKLRTFKHDYNNIVQAIGGYVISDNLEGLKHFYKELVKDCQEVNRNSMLNPEIINNPVVFNIISNKFFTAKDNRIEMNIDVFMNLNELMIKPYDLAKILGILMDNAIEAAKECENRIINIVFREEINNKRQIMIIENTYKDRDIDVIKIFEKNYSTKQRNSGIGLWEVKNILNKANNLNLHTTKNDKYFKQQLELYA